MSVCVSEPVPPERRRMVEEQIRARGVRDPRVLWAMEQTPRELFVQPADLEQAFSDRALSIAFDQSISQPYIVAAMTEALEVGSHHRVLEIGTGSGYQTAVLARLCRDVFTIERFSELQAGARERLQSLGHHNVTYRTGDGSVGWQEEAPFDRIIVTAAAPHIPKPLLDQLVNTGRLVIPVGGMQEQTLTVIERVNDRFREIPRFPCRFVKLIGQEAWTETPS